MAAPRPVPQPLPSGNIASDIISKPPTIATTVKSAPVAKIAPVKSIVITNNKGTVESESKGPPRAPLPPPPPPPAAAPVVDLYRAKFDFEGQEGEMTLKKDDLLEVVRKEDNGTGIHSACHTLLIFVISRLVAGEKRI